MIFTYRYGGHRQEYVVTFEITEGGNIISKCSCSLKKPCKHIQNLLIGRTEKVRDNEVSSLRTFISQLTKLEEGRQLIHEARSFFQEETTCRRCNSANIVDTKQKTLSARLYKMISSHRYFCKNCRWSW